MTREATPSGKYELAIFDSDGTLADTLPWMRSVFNELADEHGFRRVEPDEYERFRDLHGAALRKALHLPLWKLPRVVTGMRRKMARHVDRFSVFPGVSEMMRCLSETGLQQAIVSSNSEANVRQILGPRNSSLVNHFGCGASLFGKSARIRSVLRRSRVALGNAIYIGDEIRDAEAARAAGVVFGAVAWGQHSAEALRAQKPAEFFNSVEDIAMTLCSSNRLKQ
jgi:phosphoglycolate phosphatase